MITYLRLRHLYLYSWCVSSYVLTLTTSRLCLLLNLTRKAPWSLAECASSSSASARDISPKYHVWGHNGDHIIWIIELETKVHTKVRDYGEGPF